MTLSIRGFENSSAMILKGPQGLKSLLGVRNTGVYLCILTNNLFVNGLRIDQLYNDMASLKIKNSIGSVIQSMANA